MSAPNPNDFDTNKPKPFTAQSVLFSKPEAKTLGIFKGRLDRLGLLSGILYWTILLFMPIILAGLFAGLAHGQKGSVLHILSILCIALTIVTVILSYIFYVSFLIRRFHDLDKSGLFALLILVPFLNSVLVILLLFIPGTRGPNRFGDRAQATLSFRDVNAL